MSEPAAARTPSSGRAQAPERLVCPYRGLTPYSEADARFFFGRQEDTQLIVANLFSARVTVLFGPSGVGKSSILRAGAIRDLRQRQHQALERGERPDLLIVYFRTWQGNAMDELRRTILEEAAKLAGHAVAAPEGGKLADLLAHVTHTLGVDAMLLLDQFEEYFRYETRFSSPESFATQFGEAVGRGGLPVSILLSLREDSLAELDRFKSLAPNMFNNWFRLDRLGLAAAEEAIRGPVAEYNKLPENERAYGGTITLDEGLAAEVLQQVRTGAVVLGDGPRGAARKENASIETPYLQLVLTELWEEELTTGSKTLRVETLRRLGGAAEIVRRHVDSVLGALSSRERRMCARMFDYLVTDSGAKIAYRAGDLAEKAGVDEASMKTLLGRLAEGDKRILTTVAPAPDHPEEPQYEIYHDSLSRAVIAWRRRYVERANRRAMALRIVAIAAVVLVVLAGVAYRRNAQLAAERAEAVAHAEQEKSLQLEARSRQSAAEAQALAWRLKELEEERKGDTEQWKRLKAEADKRIEEAARYEKAAKDIKQAQTVQAPANTMPAPQDDRAALEAQRANRAERERDQYREGMEQLTKEREDLVRQLEMLRRAPAAQVPAARMERVMCRLERVRVIEDGSARDTPWRFQVTIRSLRGAPAKFELPMTLNDTKKPLNVVGKQWAVEVDPADPVVLIEIAGERLDSKLGVQLGTGYVDGRRTRTVAFVMPKADDGTVLFDFTLVRPASAR